MEEQRALYREERDDEEKNLIMITKEELLSGQNVLSMPKKVSFKHKIEKKKRNPSHHESFIIQEEEQQDFIQAPTQMDKKWNHVYENNFEKSMTMIRKLPLQYVESDKMSIEKLNNILNEHSNNIKTNAKSEEPTLSIMKDSTHLIACSMMPYIFCANGPKDGKEYSTFLVYDTTLKKRYNLTEIYYGLQEHFRNRCFNFIPFVIKDTILVALGEALFCFDFDNAFIWYRPQQLLVYPN
ncbi:hypothetical protein C9374_001005 [Naegleria lovaniensis]|uniref:Uncharacterized protein n=1 Tax=Naegleria lovaniensis TaxID=51637 RepID=A0AA88G4H8_NAELO|nr:uncharacterized protein C9374_014725 [Naegleria lovaniensis]XP_044552147.1 uncharacterized protein C9374_001005 [Naegleria lovaniensis]KAG2370641.1 hypothetical protein C9374_014725 [Naegleria lovaniensis]KAG2388155.1 hypothetical protein C9374_001005 [Naegleria lovaniensis]